MGNLFISFRIRSSVFVVVSIKRKLRKFMWVYLFDGDSRKEKIKILGNRRGVRNNRLGGGVR